VRLFISPAVPIVFAAIGQLAIAAQTAPEFQFRFTEKPGLFQVGLKVIDQYDRSRSFQIASAEPGKPSVEGTRPLQTLVWYPAKASSAQRMTVGDYAALIQTETSFDHPVDHGKPQSFVQDFTRGTTAMVTWAVRDAAMQNGRFPVAIYAPSVNAPAIENIELCEYLASNGFVVIATPSMGTSSRNMTIDIAGANAEARDISFLIDFARTLPDTDLSKTAAIGYSWGGMSALFAAAKDRRINALVSLDGSFRYSPGTVQEAGDVHPDQIAIPLLVFSRTEETLESWDAMRQSKSQSETAPNVLNEWTHGDLLHVRMIAVSHIQFSSLYQRSERFRKDALQFSPADYSLEEGAISYNWMARYALEFLNAYLNQDAEAMSFLKRTPAENGVPKHLIAATFRPASAKSNLSSVPPAK
jgi:dienelactone hydrolase